MVSTVAAPIRGETYTIEPSRDGITVNGIPVDVANVVHHGPRVDLKLGTTVAFIVEHPLAALGACGIHAAVVTGTRDAWDFFRPADREALARGQEPSAVVGPADGSIGRGVLEAVMAAGIVDTGVPLPRLAVASRVELTFNGGNRISIAPPARGDEPGLRITVKLPGTTPVSVHHALGSAIVDGEGTDIRGSLLSARSAAIAGPCQEAVLHAIGDVIADISVLGGITDGIIDASLGLAYHRCTIGLVKHLHGTGRLVAVP